MMYGDRVRTTATSRAEGRLKEFGESVRGKRKKDKPTILKDALSRAHQERRGPGMPAQQAAGRAHEAVTAAREGGAGTRPSFQPPQGPRPMAPQGPRPASPPTSIPQAAQDARRSLQPAPAAPPANIPAAADQTRQKIEELLRKRRAAQR